MQYWKPEGPYFVGDCMPFWHAGVFHLFYLLDENHHQGLGGMGGHQWAHMSTTDLVHWQHHPLALPIDQPQERSICTGAVFHHGGQYHAFYATRLPDWRQVLSRAVSDDGIHFTKVGPNPFFTPPPGYSPLHFRDPLVFAGEHGRGFHMLVSAQREDGPLPGYGGCLAHLVSPDLQEWQLAEPLLAPGFDDVPECADLFAWNGWYYLLFSNRLVTRYRMARAPLGPWLRPPSDVLDAPLARVMKTAAFGPHRRIGAAWLGTRTDDRDTGRPQWGGHLLLRELVQMADGALGTRFPAEALPPRRAAQPLALAGVTPGACREGDAFRLSAWQGLAVAAAGGVPQDVRIQLEVTPEPGAAVFGLRLRATDFADGYDLALLAHERTVRLNEQVIQAVDGLDRPYRVGIVASGDILDVCIDGRRCIIDRCPERRGEQLYFYAQNAEVVIRHVTMQPLLHENN